MDKINDDTPRILSLETIQEYVSSLKVLLGSSSFMEQKSFLGSFIRSVELNEPKVVIDYTMTLPINGFTTTQEVLRIDKYGSPGGTAPELLFEKKQLIPALQQLLVSYPRPAAKR